MIAEIGKRYRHYKNGLIYTVLTLAHHSETLEELVVYRAEYDSPDFGPHAVWARPRSMFEEQVRHEGVLVPRFTCIDEPNQHKPISTVPEL